MFYSIFENNNVYAAGIAITDVLLCTAVSLVLGLVIALVYMYRGDYSKSFIITLIILPVIVQMVIMLVNGNLGAGVAVMGAFSLVRYRSAPGSGKEISTVFLAMSIGLATGMGYLTFAVVMAFVIGIVLFLLNLSHIGEKNTAYKELRVAIPENLNYTDVFDDIFDKYCSKAVLVKAKSTNLGSMFDLHYQIVLKDPATEKQMVDEIRTRNGNLSISCSQPEVRGCADEM